MTVKFKQRGSNAIYVRVVVGRGREYYRKTKFVSNRWTKNGPYELKVRHQLQELESQIFDAFNKGVLTKRYLEKLIEGEKRTIQEQVDKILEEAPKRKNHKGGYGLSEGRVKLYISFKNVLDRFQKDVPLDIGIDFIEEFRDWLYEQYATNTVGKYCEILKTVARDGGNNKLNDFKKITEKKEITYHRDNEIEAIKSLEGLGDRLENIRKWYILGINIGQRGQDLLGLTPSNITNIKQSFFIKLTQEKTGKQIYIPIDFEIDWGYKISLQKFNKGLKDLCEVAGVTPITSHDLRRTFASRYYGEIPTPLIMSVTGHSSEATFLKYIGMSNLDYAFAFLKEKQKLT
jgi:integrase